MIYRKIQPLKTIVFTKIPQGKTCISVLMKRKTTELFTAETVHSSLP